MKTCKYLEIRTENFIFRIEKINGSIFRIRRGANLESLKNKSLIILPEINAVQFDHVTENNFYMIKTDLLTVKINKTTSQVSFHNSAGELMLIENNASIKPNEMDYFVSQEFEFEPDEGLFGLGQYQDNIMNYNGHKVVLSQSNRTIAIPFLTSSKGYGILWDNYSWTEFDTSENPGRFNSEIADCIDYYFVYGGSIDKSIEQYRYLTGQAPLYGKWAYGYWQCKERYKSFDELEEVVKEYRNRKIPIDNIIQDWQYWGELGWSALAFDEKTYPDAVKRISDLHEKYHCKLMVSIWPSIGKDTKPGRELSENNMIFPVLCWNAGYVYDVYNPDAQAIYWKYVRENLFDKGVDAFWLDGSEPEFFAAHTREEFKKQMEAGGESVIGPLKKYLNPYAVKAVQPIYEGQRKATDKKRVFILMRSGFAGQQRYAASSWSGDIAGSWDVFKRQISAGINFCMAGVPYWTHDIGGFFTNRYKKGCLDWEYRELYLRWFQFGVFTPLFRAHGTNTPREIWRFGEKGDLIYDSLVSFTKLRYKLMPYIYSCAGMITHSGYTLMRGLAMDFPDDKNTYGITDQYMFGPAVMVCPVTERMYYISDFEDGEIVGDKYFSNDGNPGLKAEYFGTKEFKQLRLEKVDSLIDFDWSGGTPEGVSYYDYSIIWHGDIESDVSGIHEMALNSCSVKLTINDECVVDKLDGEETELTSYKFKYNFERSKKYSFKLEYRRAHDCASVCLKWKKPGAKPVQMPETEKERSIYLPDNETWYDFWSNKIYVGGQNIVVQAPLEIMPLFVRAGSIIPFGPEMQYASEKPVDPVEIYIYAGKNASFTMYEDEGDNYNYEKGCSSEIKFSWLDNESKLIIEERKGDFTGMLKNRTFIPVLTGESGKTVCEPVEYSGERTQRIVNRH